MTIDPAQTRGYQRRWDAGCQAVEEARAAWGAETPLDHAHLARYTLGDKPLELEILDLFLGEAPQTLGRLEDLAATVPADAKAWMQGCHTLKGSARAVGAVHVAAAAERGEREGELTVARLQHHVTAMSAALREVSDYIGDWRVRA